MRAFVLALTLLATTVVAAKEPPYIFKRGETSHIRTDSNVSIHAVVRNAKRWDGDFIWTARDGREYLIRDAAVLAEARRAFAELDAFAAEQRAFEKRYRPVEKRRDALENRAEAIEEELEDSEDLRESDRRALKSRLRELEQELRSMEREVRALENEEERLDQHSERLERVAERELEEIIVRAIRRGRYERVY